MLVSLHIENIAVIKCIDIDFSGGFTALTGETGAGKSILIDSIGFLLGARSSRDLLRSGEEKALVSAMFSGFNQTALNAFAQYDVSPDEDGNLFVSRSMTVDGRTQSKINGRSVSSGIVREIAHVLVNIHGQNESLKLLEDENHIVFLDAYAKNQPLIDEYRIKFEAYKSAKNDLNVLENKKREKDRREAELKNTYRLLDTAKIKVGEEEKLLEEKKLLANAEKISKQTSFVWRALKGSDKANAAYILDRCAVALSQISDSLPAASELSERLKNLQYEAEDIAETVYGFAGGSPEEAIERLDKVESRIAAIQRLKKHFSTDEAGLVSLFNETKNELCTLQNLDQEVENAKRVCENAYNDAVLSASVVTNSRLTAANALIPLVLHELDFLDMGKVVFDISITPTEKLFENGADNVIFLISANKGENPRPISKIASGGELARIMLAIKTVFADAFGVNTVIYDEVDTGVSGKTARKIGIKLKESARATQTVCVTHSAQIASLANEHMLIYKSVVGERTETTVRVIDGEERTAEIARILGGVTISENMMVSARELIEEGKKI